jgi:hypothetical protein
MKDNKALRISTSTNSSARSVFPHVLSRRRADSWTCSVTIARETGFRWDCKSCVKGWYKDPGAGNDRLNSKKVFNVRSDAMIWAEEFMSGSRVEMRAFNKSLQVIPPKASVKTAPKLELAS